MQLLFYGMALILLDVSVTAGNAVIGLLPDWLGYYFLLKGLNSIPEKLVEGKIRKFLPVMLPVSLAAYVLSWFQGNYQMRFLVWRVGIVCAVLQLFVSWALVSGICRQDDRKKLGSATLKSMWLFFLVLHLLSAALKLIPVVGWVCEMADLVMGICFLVALQGCLKRLQASRKERT